MTRLSSLPFKRFLFMRDRGNWKHFYRIKPTLKTYRWNKVYMASTNKTPARLPWVSRLPTHPQIPHTCAPTAHKEEENAPKAQSISLFHQEGHMGNNLPFDSQIERVLKSSQSILHSPPISEVMDVRCWYAESHPDIHSPLLVGTLPALAWI